MEKQKLGGWFRAMGKISFLKIGALILSFLLLGACGVRLLPSKDVWYMQNYIIMQDFERAAYKDLSPEAKVKFQSLFWEARSPEAKREYTKRMDFVMKTYKRENSSQPWNTDRARIYLLNGSPASIEYKQTDNWAMKVKEGAGEGGMTGITDQRDTEDIQARTAEVWTYNFGNQFVYYAFSFSAPKRWKLDQGAFAGNRYLGELENWSREKIYNIIDIDRYKKELDDLKKIE